MSQKLPAKKLALLGFLRGQALLYWRVFRHPQSPLSAKAVMLLAVGYALLPFDISTDFLLFFGQIDDALIVPGLLMLAMRLVPPGVVEKCRTGDGGSQRNGKEEKLR